MTSKYMASNALVTASLLLAGLMAVGCGNPAPEGESWDDETSEADDFDDSDVDAIDEEELGRLTQALTSECGDAVPDRTMNSSYSNSDVKSGLGSFGFVSNYNTCGKGFFVQVDSFKPYEDGNIGVPTGDFRNIGESECPNALTRLYVWEKQAGTFRFVDSYTQKGAFRNGSCVQRFDHVRQDRLEALLHTGATVKYALTARRGDTQTIVPVRMATARIVR